ncbi:hypothetical protein MKX03_014599 [Papaver bracteatum]|nr:hypothetical protein MKX03_014599 [Papaver bracteatum]
MANSILMSPLESTKFIWTIENFSSLNDKETHRSSYFVAGGCTWWIKIYPKGFNGQFGMYLMSKGLGNKSPYAEFSLTVFNQKNHKKTVTWDAKHVFVGAKCWGFSNMMPLSDLHDPGKGFIVEDTCILKVEISVGWPNDSNIKVDSSTPMVNSETVVYPDAGKPFEKDEGVVFYDDNHDIVGGFILTATSYNSLVTIVTDVMNTVLDMYRCRYIDVSTELIDSWDSKIILAEKLGFNVSWLRGSYNDIEKDYISGRIEKLQKEAEDKEGPTPVAQVKNEPVDDIQAESLPGFLFEGML